MNEIAAPVRNNKSEILGYAIDCPGCETWHVFYTSHWKFNGDVHKPTFTPSMLSNKDRSCKTLPRCHSFVTDGRIKFLADCTHELKGKTVELLPIDREV